MSKRLDPPSSESESPLQVMPPPRKSVSFHSTCAVVLIPSRREYVDAGIDLWFNRKDQTAAQTQVANELKQLISYNPALTVETAMKFLYQPQIHLDAAMFAKEADTVSPLNIMVVDRQESSAKEAANSINQKLQSHNRWNLSVKHCTSGESAVKHFVTPSGYASILDVVLIDESIFTVPGQPISASVHNQTLSHLVGVFRSAYGASVLLGICLSDSGDIEAIREYAIKVGIDFIWAKPITVFADMLPLILVSRARTGRDGCYKSGTPCSPPRKIHRDSMSNLLSSQDDDVVSARNSSSSTDCESSSPLASPLSSPLFRHAKSGLGHATPSVLPMLFASVDNKSQSQPMCI